VLGRGYAIVTGPSGEAIHEARAVSPGDALTVRVHRGRIQASVIEAYAEDESGAGEGALRRANG
jgi:exodeoxyribonuclease VII large subunit